MKKIKILVLALVLLLIASPAFAMSQRKIAMSKNQRKARVFVSSFYFLGQPTHYIKSSLQLIPLCKFKSTSMICGNIKIKGQLWNNYSIHGTNFAKILKSKLINILGDNFNYTNLTVRFINWCTIIFHTPRSNEQLIRRRFYTIFAISGMVKNDMDYFDKVVRMFAKHIKNKN